MGNCLTGDVAGGKQAIGGVQQRPTSTATTNNAAQNDAVDFFFRSRGQYPLFSQIEVSLSKKKQNLGFICVFVSCLLLLLSSVWFIYCSRFCIKTTKARNLWLEYLLNWKKNNDHNWVKSSIFCLGSLVDCWIRYSNLMSLYFSNGANHWLESLVFVHVSLCCFFYSYGGPVVGLDYLIIFIMWSLVVCS